MLSINRVLQDGFYALLTASASSLAPDARDLIIVKDMPESAFAQKSFPKIAIYRPVTAAREMASSDHYKMEFNVIFLILDVTGGNFNKDVENLERLDILSFNVMSLIDKMDRMDLGCTDVLGILPEFNSWTTDNVAKEEGNNLVGTVLQLRLTVLVNRNTDLNNFS